MGAHRRWDTSEWFMVPFSKHFPIPSLNQKSAKVWRLGVSYKESFFLSMQLLIDNYDNDNCLEVTWISVLFLFKLFLLLCLTFKKYKKYHHNYSS